jgi:predicted transcriptional regulator
MRTLVDIPDDQVRALAEIARRHKVSRAALIRAAIAELIVARRVGAKDAFGLWRGGEDGLAYQDRVRGEW